MAKQFDRKIVLENGAEFYGWGFGSMKESIAEAVFNTSMVGYQEIVSDPSYTGQMVVMTYPIIGNYGMTDEDFESRTPTMGGLIVRDYNNSPSNFRYTKTLAEILEDYDIPAIYGVDTRMIVNILRSEGTQKIMITSPETTREEAIAKMNAYELPHDLISKVSTKKKWYARTASYKYNVVAVDCGVRLSTIRTLNACGCNVTVVPYNTSAEEILKLKPDGVLISNGPGGPFDIPEVVDTVKALIGITPIFGMCIGHQLVAQAYGAKVTKMKVGHRGANHPIRNLLTGKVEIAGQNHSYVVEKESLSATKLELTHENILDGTVEGTRCVQDKVITVQFHPDSVSGTAGATYLFDEFIAMMKEAQNNA
ncbi:MAG: glutamine-hydrolyzing carbamoyl-phosphate synthase small subunit [Clostridia bacterium]|nr:glutamine-hydrolyzing carbamoyl-phosphate synthase small subunit [Clostridia bacterium]